MPHLNLDYELLNYLVDKGFVAGDRLPTISELQNAEHLGINVSKVREQLEVARALGLVEVRSKTGMRLKPYSFTPAVQLSLFFALAQDPHIFEMFTTLRNHIEIAFWHEACAVLTDDCTREMRQCVVSAREKLSNPYISIPNQEHQIFHLTMFKNLDNPFVIGILEAYWEAYNTIEPNRYADLAYHHSVWDYHERILNAICDQDYDRAQQFFIEHTRLMRYTPPTEANDSA